MMMMLRTMRESYEHTGVKGWPLALVAELMREKAPSPGFNCLDQLNAGLVASSLGPGSSAGNCAPGRGKTAVTNSTVSQFYPGFAANFPSQVSQHSRCDDDDEHGDAGVPLANRHGRRSGQRRKRMPSRPQIARRLARASPRRRSFQNLPRRSPPTTATTITSISARNILDTNVDLISAVVLTPNILSPNNKNKSGSSSQRSSASGFKAKHQPGHRPGHFHNPPVRQHPRHHNSSLSRRARRLRQPRE